VSAEGKSVRVEKNGAVTTVILHRPEARNAVDGPTAKLLADAFRAFDADDTASVAVLFGDGGTFCAGADLKALGGDRMNKVEPLTPAGAPRTQVTDGPMGPTRMTLKKPVIAAIAGHAVAGGLELACWCDLRVVEEDATMGVFCRRWGVPLIDGGTVRLPRLIGLSVAMDLILTGRAVRAEEALRIGLANRVVGKGESRREAESLAAEIARAPQTCMREDRASAIEQHAMSLHDALDNELRHGMRSLSSTELAEGVGRFVAGAGRGGKSI
jgi:enoyl-CoA hydratase